jgi:hypothetical protein
MSIEADTDILKAYINLAQNHRREDIEYILLLNEYINLFKRHLIIVASISVDQSAHILNQVMEITKYQQELNHKSFPKEETSKIFRFKTLFMTNEEFLARCERSEIEAK